MSQKSPIKPVIKAFEEDKNQIFVVYGIELSFEDIIGCFRKHFQGRKGITYLVLNMEDIKCNTRAEIIFEIIQKLGDQFTPKISGSYVKGTLHMLQILRERTKTRGDEAQLDVFMHFTEFMFYPELMKSLGGKNRSIIIEFEQFERVAKWGKEIRNYILEKLLKKVKGVNFRFVLFVQSPDRPRLYYGSAEEYIDNVTFYKIS